jgi:hypothetical protein
VITVAPASIDALATISLDDLNAIAELQTRTDRKYVIDAGLADELVDELSDGLLVLEIDGGRTFGYSSVYFDTVDFDLYRAAATGRRRRFKVRTRMYQDSGRSMLEVKTKDGRGRTVKSRLDYDSVDIRRLTEDGLDFIGDVLAESSIDVDEDLDLRPVMTTEYRRTTLVHPATATRATIDRDLVCLDAAGRSVELDGVIVESKSDSSAGPIDRWLWSRRHRPVPMSKYGTGLAALDPALPANKWHRTLGRHFS